MRIIVWSAVIGLAGCGKSGKQVSPVEEQQDDSVEQEEQAEQAEPEEQVRTTTEPEVEATVVTVRQDPGRLVYWVLPGPRELDPELFGTPEAPLRTGDLPVGAAEPLRELVGEVPYLLGVPVDRRQVSEDGERFTQTTFQTPFSDNAVPVSGWFEMTLYDIVSGDLEGPPTDTSDRAELKATFTDPAGHEYEIVPKTVFQPPIPGFETDGGVLVEGQLHGGTGTGTPLMPEVYAYAATWVLSDVRVNGETIASDVLTHFATTQATRNKEAELVGREELPLPKDQTIAGQEHHTQVLVLPIAYRDGELRYEPLRTAYELQDGTRQAFIHVTYEQDVIVEGPDFNPPVASAEE